MQQSPLPPHLRRPEPSPFHRAALPVPTPSPFFPPDAADVIAAEPEEDGDRVADDAERFIVQRRGVLRG